MRFHAAACQTDFPCPKTRREIAERTARMAAMVEQTIVGYEPFFDVRLLAFPEFAHAAPVYETVAQLRKHLAVPVPNEHTRVYEKLAKNTAATSRPGRSSRPIPSGRTRCSTRPCWWARKACCSSTAR
jgi:hypothetical protein